MQIFDEATYRSVRGGLTPLIDDSEVGKTLLAAGRRHDLPIPSFDEFTENTIVFALSYKHHSRFDDEGTISENLASNIQNAITEIMQIEGKSNVSFWIDQLLHRESNSVDDTPWYQLGYLPYAKLVTLLSFKLDLRRSRPWLWAEFKLASWAGRIWAPSFVKLSSHQKFGTSVHNYNHSSCVKQGSTEFRLRWMRALFEVARWTPSKDQESYPYKKEFEEFSVWAEMQLETLVLQKPPPSNEVERYLRPIEIWYKLCDELADGFSSKFSALVATNAKIEANGSVIIGRERWKNIPLSLFGNISGRFDTSERRRVFLTTGNFSICNEERNGVVLSNFIECGSRGFLDFRSELLLYATPITPVQPYKPPKCSHHPSLKAFSGFRIFPRIEIRDWLGSRNAHELLRNAKWIFTTASAFQEFVESQWYMSREQLHKGLLYIEAAQKQIGQPHEHQLIARPGPLRTYLYIGGKSLGTGSFLAYCDEQQTLIIERSVVVRNDVELELYNVDLDGPTVKALVCLALGKIQDVARIGSGVFFDWRGTGRSSALQMTVQRSFILKCQVCATYQNAITGHIFQVTALEGGLEPDSNQDGCTKCNQISNLQIVEQKVGVL